ncbi:hypothetical protein OG800_50315 (plasmid) [Streptomyces sp. NBC_00445]|uniref:hypothetical protein n=1 Tax=Streptomyces sp. NBC_00445 TaxID=2975745 RepID=UPI002E1D6613
MPLGLVLVTPVLVAVVVEEEEPAPAIVVLGTPAVRGDLPPTGRLAVLQHGGDFDEPHPLPLRVEALVEQLRAAGLLDDGQGLHPGPRRRGGLPLGLLLRLPCRLPLLLGRRTLPRILLLFGLHRRPARLVLSLLLGPPPLVLLVRRVLLASAVCWTSRRPWPSRTTTRRAVWGSTATAHSAQDIPGSAGGAGHSPRCSTWASGPRPTKDNTPLGQLLTTPAARPRLEVGPPRARYNLKHL